MRPLLLAIYFGLPLQRSMWGHNGPFSLIEGEDIPDVPVALDGKQICSIFSERSKWGCESMAVVEQLG